MSAAPERTCVGCRGKAPKATLVRLVRAAGGRVEVDPRGAAAGRGAYLHRDRDCVEAALRKGSLARALRTGGGTDEVGRLRELLEGMSRDT